MTLRGVTAIVLAAGRSQRMGSPKALVEYRGVTLLRAQCEQMRTLGAARVIVVVGAGHARIRAATASDVPGESVAWIVNGAPRRGPFSSLILALTLAQREGFGEQPCVITPVDVPPVREDIFRVLRHAAAGAECAVVPEFAGHGGHPVWLTPRGVARVLAHPVSPARGRLDHLLALWGNDVRRVVVDDDTVLRNWNTPADLLGAQARGAEKLAQ